MREEKLGLIRLLIEIRWEAEKMQRFKTSAGKHSNKGGMVIDIFSVCILTLIVWILFMLPNTSGAETINTLEQLPNILPLSNKNLISVLQESGYDGWDFYQPSAREFDTNTSSSHYLDVINAYPIIAINNDDVCLIVLRKTNKQWTVSVTNSRALTREGFILKGFSLDEYHSEVDNIQDVFFDFEDKAGNLLTLNLQLSDIYPSYFAFMQSENMRLVFNYDRGITMQFDFPFIFRCSYEINPKQSIPFNVDEFSFAECPITIQELLVPSSISPHGEVASLFAFPDDSMEPVFQLTQDENIYIIYQQNMSDWVLVFYKDNLLFAHNADITLNDEN